MSRHHRAHKRGWPRIRARAILDAGRRCALAAVDLAVLKCIIVRPLSRGGTHNQGALEVVCRVCHFLHHNTDPARLAWARFLQEEYPC